jgi:hypothetical protein
VETGRANHLNSADRSFAFGFGQGAKTRLVRLAGALRNATGKTAGRPIYHSRFLTAVCITTREYDASLNIETSETPLIS